MACSSPAVPRLAIRGRLGERDIAVGLASPPMRTRALRGIVAGMHPHLHIQFARALIAERLRQAETRRRLAHSPQLGDRRSRQSANPAIRRRSHCDRPRPIARSRGKATSTHANERTVMNNSWTSSTVRSADGTTIAYDTLGSGQGVIVVGGVLRTAHDYRELGHQLADAFTVHLMERRGRGASGPQGPAYSIEKECEDLLAVQADTGAERVFGHSYGGLAVLQTARRTATFRQIAVYEPGVLLDGSASPAWLDSYRELLARADTQGAFATMVKHAGFAPRPLAATPLLGLRVILQLGVRGQEWLRTEALLETNLAEQEAQLAARGIVSYAEIGSSTLLIGGSESPPIVAAQLEALRHTIPGASVSILDGLDHPAPETRPGPVASCVKQFFTHEFSERRPDAVDVA